MSMGYSVRVVFEDQQSSDEEELDYDTEDGSIDQDVSGFPRRLLGRNVASSSMPERTRRNNVRIGGSGLPSYFQDDSRDSLHGAISPDIASSSSSMPERTRRNNVRIGGSGLPSYFQDDSRGFPGRALGRGMTLSQFSDDNDINRRGNVNIVNHNLYSTTINQVGHTFIQNAGFRDSRQFQALNVSGGTVTQGNALFAGGGAGF